jgi:hypothetical protein
MARVACIMMQRDEALLLQPWLVYHGYLFGFENLFVFDNGSTDASVIATIERFAAVGVNFDLSYREEGDYERKAELMIDTINRLDGCGKYTAYIPMDCDEFLVSFDDGGLNCSRFAIGDCLDQILPEDRILRIGTLLYNIPGFIDRYYAQDLAKIMFTGGVVEHLEHGNHKARTTKSQDYVNVSLTYLHFHNRPFRDMIRFASLKLQNRVNVNDRNALLNYRGHGEHLIRYFSMSERDYVASFRDRNYVFFPEFRRLLAALGACRPITSACATECEVMRLGAELPRELNSLSYLAANTDVAKANVPALMHYYCHGKNEGRPLCP